VRAVLTDPRTLRLPYWNRATVESMPQAHLAGRTNHTREINAVLTLEAIDRLLLRASAWPAAEVGPPLAWAHT
jgi:hypothetical protein